MRFCCDNILDYMFKAIIHIAVAFSVFFSSGGFWVNSHYCEDEFVKTSFFFSFGSCCAKEAATPCSDEGHSKEGHEEEEGCCHNESSYYKLDQDQQIQITGIEVTERVVTWNAIVPALPINLPSFDKHTFPYLHYVPPLIVYDLQVQLQSFLC